jgi:uncharacterized protein YcfJ
MKTSYLFCAMAGAGLLAALPAQAQQELGRVISTVPVIQQVAVPRQVCNSQPVVVEQPRTGAGALMGALAGGAAGNAIGGGSGRAAATVIGVMGGALLGNRIEGTGTQVQQQTQCATQTFYENRTVGYNVTYEYAGKQYMVQMPQDPGPTVRLQVTPVGAGNAPPPSYSAPTYPAPMSGPPQPQVSAPQYAYPPQVVTTVAPVYASSYYYAPAYVRPAPLFYPNVSLSLGWVGGHHHHHRH